MRRLFKILILIIAIVPLWLTVIAMAESSNPLESWRLRINDELLKVSDQKIQIIEVLEMSAALTENDRSQNLQIDLSRVQPKGVSALGLKIMDAEGRLLKYSEVKARILIQWKVPVTLVALKKGDRISEKSFEWKWVDAAALSRSPVRAISPVDKEVKSFIPANQVMYHRQIDDGQTVKRGSRVRITALKPGISITTTGVAQENGNLGDTIRVLNLDSKKELFGVVTNSESVEVQL